MKFVGIVKSSLIDYPGKISIVLFTPGCNLDCYYCHNRALIEDFVPAIDNHEILSLIERRVGLIDAIVITGGEPTLHPELEAFLRQVKALGYVTKLDTNGMNPTMVRDLNKLGLVDYFAVDYKAPKARYVEICGSCADPSKTLETIAYLTEVKANFEVRTTVVPELELNDLLTMASELPLVPRYVLNSYRRPERFREEDRERIEVPPYPDQTIHGFEIEVKLIQPHVVLHP
ncbi:MAG: anaerobic ribonucleoside-triphosphate reductase activating protein [Bacillus subtilis]|nr:anaerobic ribonucleoside-triphosphate reductase activating protein [Bacillus subtilis]